VGEDRDIYTKEEEAKEGGNENELKREKNTT